MTVDLPDPTVGWAGDLLYSPDVPRRWRLLPGTATIPWACTIDGIKEICGGHCCYDLGYWPPNTAGQRGAPCPRLGPTGCTLADRRPVTCLLHPLTLNRNGTLQPDNITRYPWACRGARRPKEHVAPPLVVAMQESLTLLFGYDQWMRACAATLHGQPHEFEVSDDLVRRLAWDAAQMLGREVPAPCPDDWTPL